MSGVQEAAWESELQARDWQQHLIHQRQRARPSLQRCGPSRSISLPSTSQQCQVPLSRGRCDPHSSVGPYPSQSDSSAPAAALDPLPTLRDGSRESSQPCQPVTMGPVIRVPCSTDELDVDAAADTQTAVHCSSLGSSTAQPSVADAAQHRAPFSSSARRPLRRQGSDVGSSTSKAYQPIPSLAASTRTASLQTAAMTRAGQSSKAREQSEMVAAARVKAVQMARGAGLSSSGKNKLSADVRLLSQGVGGKGAQVSLIPRYKIALYSWCLGVLCHCSSADGTCRFGRGAACTCCWESQSIAGVPGNQPKSK